ncbi:hypothetical protein DL546_004327 [Coniochaeta pulveracea]|uniref:Uncharacterized protein n=1 Tax=Coniochaeta pulveracea TaxID=177199 RepID=A0A420Y6Y0_9PEZI|nr:hypothetical protein DL546_004327 [Coniochaeta pulveracea]
MRTHHQLNAGNGMHFSMPKLRELRLLSMPRQSGHDPPAFHELPHQPRVPRRRGQAEKQEGHSPPLARGGDQENHDARRGQHNPPKSGSGPSSTSVGQPSARLSATGSAPPFTAFDDKVAASVLDVDEESNARVQFLDCVNRSYNIAEESQGGPPEGPVPATHHSGPAPPRCARRKPHHGPLRRGHLPRARVRDPPSHAHPRLSYPAARVVILLPTLTHESVWARALQELLLASGTAAESSASWLGLQAMNSPAPLEFGLAPYPGGHGHRIYHEYLMDEEDEKDEKEGLENDKDEEMSPVVDTVTAAALGSVAESYHFPPDAG